MYRISLILVSLFLWSSLAFAGSYCSQAQMCYLFTEGSGTTVADSSGHGNTGTFNSSGHPAWTTTVPSFGVSGSAANSAVSDATSYINTGNSTIVQNGNSVTVVAWIYITSLAASQPNRIIDVSGNIVFGFDVASTDLVIKMAGSTPMLHDSNTGAFALNTWTFVAFTSNLSTTASSSHIYTATLASPTVTEVSYATTTNGVTLSSNTGNNLYLLNRNDAARPMLGNATQIGVFNSILSTSDLQNIFNYGLGATVANIGGGLMRLDRKL